MFSRHNHESCAPYYDTQSVDNLEVDGTKIADVNTQMVEQRYLDMVATQKRKSPE